MVEKTDDELEQAKLTGEVYPEPSPQEPPSVPVSPSLGDLPVLPLTGEQKETLRIYDDTAQAYVDRTEGMEIGPEAEIFLSHVPKDGLILDAGAGSGRYSKYFLDRGYRVESIDGSANLAELAQARIGQKVRVLLFEELDYEGHLDGTFAYFSFIHLPKDHLENVLKRVFCGLKPGGVLYATFAYGQEPFQLGGRYFNAFDEQSMRSLVETTDFEILEVSKKMGTVSNGKQEPYLEVILKRPTS